MMVRKLGIAAATGVLLVTAACGGGGGRPSVDDIQKSLTGKGGDLMGLGDGLSDKVAECMAKALEKSDLSDKALNALVDADKDYKGSSEDTKALTGVGSDIAKCATADTE